jgi:hypothetical protein
MTPRYATYRGDMTVRGWATRSSDGRTHAGFILNPGKSMRAYAVPGQWITLYSNRPPFTFLKRWITRWYIRTSLRSALFTIFLFWLAGFVILLTIIYYPFRIYTLPLTTLEFKDKRAKYLMVKHVPVCISV